LVDRELGSNRFNSMDQFVRASDKSDPLYKAVDALLKGPEISLVDHGQLPFVDKDGHVRSDARLRWCNEGATTLRELAELSDTFTTEDGQPYPPLPDIEIGASERSYAYDSAVPVFYGHYWREGSPKFGVDWTEHTASVDFNAVKRGTLTAYRWGGETEAAMDGVMNDRTIRVSNSKPSAIVVPIWPSTIRSLNMNDAMVKANTSPAAVTTEPLPAIARMMPVLMPAPSSSLNRRPAVPCPPRSLMSLEPTPRTD
jgi:hypothetical protein